MMSLTFGMFTQVSGSWPLGKGCFVQENKQEVTKVVSLCKNDRKTQRCTHTPLYRKNVVIILDILILGIFLKIYFRL